MIRHNKDDIEEKRVRLTDAEAKVSISGERLLAGADAHAADAVVDRAAGGVVGAAAAEQRRQARHRGGRRAPHGSRELAGRSAQRDDVLLAPVEQRHVRVLDVTRRLRNARFRIPVVRHLHFIINSL